jgi:hypothetical protein
MNEQTAIEWLFAHLLPFLEFSDPKEREYYRKCLAEAKAMEREQIVDAFNEKNHEFNGWKRVDLSGEQYYNETYGGDK